MQTLVKRNHNRELRKRRSRAKIFGTAQKPRLSVFISNRNIYAQLIDDTAGKTLIATNSFEVKGKNNAEQAKKIGALLAEKAKKAGITSALLHRGHYQYQGRLKTLTESAREAGLTI